MANPQFSDPFNHSNNPISLHIDWDYADDGSSTEAPKSDGDALLIDGDDDFEGYAIAFQTACDSVTQCVLIEVKDQAGTEGSFGSMMRQVEADATGDNYFCNMRYSGSQWELNWERYTGGAFSELMQTRYNITEDPVDGDWIGFAVTGTDTDTVLEYWNFGNSYPGVFSNWDLAGADENYEMSVAGGKTYCDVGLYVGVSLYYLGFAHHAIDTWYGGDQAAVGGPTVPEQTFAPTAQQMNSGGMIGIQYV